MKKSIKWGLGAGVLVLLVGAGIASQQAPKTTTKSTETATKEASQADKDSYEKALAAIKTAEESLSDKDIATAKKLVKKATRQQALLKAKLKSLEAGTHWRTLKSLIATAKANPTEATIQAAQDELHVLLKNSKAMKYNKKSDYINQVHELLLKQTETYIAKAEETTTEEDFTTASNSLIDLYNAALLTWQQWSYPHENALDALQARLTAIQIGSKVTPAQEAPVAEQATQPVAGEGAGSTDYTQNYAQGGSQGYTQGGGQTYSQGGNGYTPSGGGSSYAAAQIIPGGIEGNITVTDENFNNPDNWMTFSDGTRRYIGPFGQ